MAYFKTMDINISGKDGATAELRDDHKVLKEGVYYSYFIYERVPLSQDPGQATNPVLDNIQSKSGGHHLMSLRF